MSVTRLPVAPDDDGRELAMRSSDPTPPSMRLGSAENRLWITEGHEPPRWAASLGRNLRMLLLIWHVELRCTPYVRSMSAVNRYLKRSDPASRIDQTSRGQRDAMLRRARSIAKSTGIAAMAATLGIAIYVSRAVPGHSTTTSGRSKATAASGHGSTSSTASAGSSSTFASNHLSAPATVPVQTKRSASTVSGAT